MDWNHEPQPILIPLNCFPQVFDHSDWGLHSGGMCVQVCAMGERRGGRKPDFFKEHRHSSSTSHEISLGQDLTCSSIMSSVLPEVSCFTLVCTKHRGKLVSGDTCFWNRSFWVEALALPCQFDTTLSSRRYFCLPPLWHLSIFLFLLVFY